ncbi:MAG TPA: SHOCT domain-containing protein [Herpetosiphonaceae bacterium]
MMQAYATMPWWMIISMIAFWIVIATLILLIVVQLTRSIQPRRETPLEVAQRRFAMGEIGRAEFEEVRRVLSQAPASVGETSTPSAATIGSIE